MIFKKIFSDEEMVNILLEKNLVSSEAVEEAGEILNRIRNEGKPYLGAILVDYGFIKAEVLERFNQIKSKAFEDFCQKLVDRGYMKIDHFRKVKEIKKANPDKDVAEIVIENGFMGRDSFYRFFANFSTMPKLGEVLISKKFITKEQLEQALAIQKMNSLVEILIFKKHLSRETLETVKKSLSHV